MEVNFSECEFIDREMWFYTYYDFCDQCYQIKKLFNKLSRNGRKFYMWYVYSNVHMQEYFKNAIWDYLNCDDVECYEHLINLKKNYKVK